MTYFDAITVLMAALGSLAFGILFFGSRRLVIRDDCSLVASFGLHKSWFLDQHIARVRVGVIEAIYQNLRGKVIGNKGGQAVSLVVVKGA